MPQPQPRGSWTDTIRLLLLPLLPGSLRGSGVHCCGSSLGLLDPGLGLGLELLRFRGGDGADVVDAWLVGPVWP